MRPSEPNGPDHGAGAPDADAPRAAQPAPASFPVRAMWDRSAPHPVVPASGRRAGWLAILTIALLAAVIALAIAWSRERRGHARDKATLSEQVRVLQGRVEEAEGEADDRLEAMDALTGPQLSVFELVAPGSPETKGRVFWNRASGTWTMLAQDMAAPARGRTYQLWLVARDGQRVNAGTFEPDDAGHALARVTYEMEPARLAGVEVTDEPEGGSTQPTGAPVLSSAPAR